MAKRKKSVFDADTCPPGYYWVRPRDGNGKAVIMEKGKYGGKWWSVGWDIPRRDMIDLEVLGEVAPWRKRRKGSDDC